jgi:DNA modification methylase
MQARCETGKQWAMYLGDACEVIKGMPDESIDLSIFSPPFSNLYIYSDSIADIGNCDSSREFFEHFSFLAHDLFRVTVPGRLVAIHCKDLPKYFGRDGAAGLSDFPGDIIRCFESHGFTFHSRVTIWKDPVIEMQRTKNNGLLHKTLCRDSSQSRQGMADYMIVMRKAPADSLMSAKPVTRDHSQDTCFHEYHGNKEEVRMSAYCKAGEPAHGPGYGLQVWQRYASPVWFDIDQTNVLNHRVARDEKDEKHICPLQLDVAARAIELWSNKGDVVLSPFAGIGSEGYQALLMQRRFVGIELKEGYFDLACRHLRIAEKKAKEIHRTLFDDLDDEPVEAGAEAIQSNL